MTNNQQAIIPGEFFHLYNRAVGDELLFQSDVDYDHWLDLLKQFLLPLCEIHAYCLLPNHYHLLVKIKEDADAVVFSKKTGDAANAFVKWKNLKYGRKGGLFMTPFKRKMITDEHYLIWCLWYIHRNPLHHHYSADWQNWKYSSYKAYTSEKPTLINKAFFLDLLGGKELFMKHHTLQAGEDSIMSKVILE